MNYYNIDYLSYGEGSFISNKTKQSDLNKYATMSYALSNAVAKSSSKNPVYYSIEDYVPDAINWAP